MIDISRLERFRPTSWEWRRNILLSCIHKIFVIWLSEHTLFLTVCCVYAVCVHSLRKFDTVVGSNLTCLLFGALTSVICEHLICVYSVLQIQQMFCRVVVQKMLEAISETRNELSISVQYHNSIKHARALVYALPTLLSVKSENSQWKSVLTFFWF